MATRADIVTCARTLIGVPYAHGQHSRFGLDCIGLLIRVAKDCGLLPAAFTPCVYSQQWHLHKHAELLRDTLEALGAPGKAVAARQPGDIVLLRFGRVLSHGAICTTPGRIIHALRSTGCVVETGFEGDWLRRAEACYAFPGVHSDD